MTQSNSNQDSFGPLFRLAGYCLLALSLLDLLGLFIPPRFLDPAWEFQLVSQLVDRVPVPLLGLVLVLVTEQRFRIFKFLSWASLITGVLFLLLVPLAVSSAWRVEQQNAFESSQRTTELTQRVAQIQQLKSQLNAAKTPTQINDVLSRLNPQGAPLALKNPDEAKKQVLARIGQAEQVAQAQVASQANNSLNLLKTAIRLVLGSLISGAVFLTIWNKTLKVLKASKPKPRPE